MNDRTRGPTHETGETAGDPMIPVRLSEEGRVATWNPGIVRAARVVLRVRLGDGTVADRSSMNSGRARVREGERIEGVYVEGDG
jgi:hypothetical protein